MTSLPVVEGPYLWLKDLTRGWTILPVASYYKLYYAIALPVGKCMYLCSKFQSKSNEVRCDELSPNTKLQISNNARSKNITLIQYMDRFKAFNILIHHLDIAFKTSQLISASIYYYTQIW